MAALFYGQMVNRRNIRRNRVFRDRSHPLEIYSDEKVFKKFRFRRHEILELTNRVRDGLVFHVQRKGALTPLLQVLLGLRFYATGAIQDAVGDLIGVEQPTVSRVVTRVTNELVDRCADFIFMPSQREADTSKQTFFAMARLPNVFACIDGTQVRIQAPEQQEHEFVNRRNFHSINVQVSLQPVPH